MDSVVVHQADQLEDNPGEPIEGCRGCTARQLQNRQQQLLPDKREACPHPLAGHQQQRHHVFPPCSSQAGAACAQEGPTRPGPGKLKHRPPGLPDGPPDQGGAGGARAHRGQARWPRQGPGSPLPEGAQPAGRPRRSVREQPLFDWRPRPALPTGCRCSAAFLPGGVPGRPAPGVGSVVQGCPPVHAQRRGSTWRLPQSARLPGKRRARPAARQPPGPGQSMQPPALGPAGLRPPPVERPPAGRSGEAAGGMSPPLHPEMLCWVRCRWRRQTPPAVGTLATGCCAQAHCCVLHQTSWPTMAMASRLRRWQCAACSPGAASPRQPTPHQPRRASRSRTRDSEAAPALAASARCQRPGRRCCCCWQWRPPTRCSLHLAPHTPGPAAGWAARRLGQAYSASCEPRTGQCVCRLRGKGACCLPEQMASPQQWCPSFDTAARCWSGSTAVRDRWHREGGTCSRRLQASTGSGPAAG